MTPLEIALAEQLITQGLQFWQSFQERKDKGLLTAADLTAAALKLDVDIAQLERDILAANKAADVGGPGSTPAVEPL